MKTAPSEELQGVAEEIVEVDVEENKIIGDPNAPNKDTNTDALTLTTAPCGAITKFQTSWGFEKSTEPPFKMF